MAIDANDPRRGSFATGSSRQTADAAKQSANKARASSPSLSRSTPARSKSPAASKTVSRASAPTNQAFGDRASKPSGEQGAKKTQSSRTGFPSGKADSGKDSRRAVTPAMFDASKQRFAQQPSLSSFRPVPRPAEQGTQGTTRSLRPIPRPTAQVAPQPAPQPTAQQYLDGPRTAMPVAQQYLDGPRTADRQQEAMADAFFARLAGQQIGQQAPAQPLDRATADDMMEDFAGLERRVELEPYFANNPMAQLGYVAGGGSRSVDYLPLDINQAAVFPTGYSGPEYAADMGSGDDFYMARAQNIYGSIEAMDPARAEAFADDYSQNQNFATTPLVPVRNIGLGPNFMGPSVESHEFAHKGVDVIQDMLRENPEMRSRLYRGLPMSEGLPPQRYSRGYDTSNDGLVPMFNTDVYPTYSTPIGWEPEESLVELRDNPADTWIQPSGATVTMEPTIQYQRDVGTQEYPPTLIQAGQTRRRDQIMQEIAREELARRGVPPRATMQGDAERAVQGMQEIRRDFAPDRGEQQNRGLFGGGIGGLFGRIFGR